MVAILNQRLYASTKVRGLEEDWRQLFGTPYNHKLHKKHAKTEHSSNSMPTTLIKPKIKKFLNLNID